MKDDTIFILTDGCMYEQNKRNKTSHSHAVEVVDSKTGAIRYINSGSRIKFVEGQITDIRTQAQYNKETSKLSNNNEDKLRGSKGKRGSKAKDKSAGEDKSL